MASGYIVTGTDTGVGKTVVAAGLSQALRARYWKPVQAGLEDETDSHCVARLAPAARILPEGFSLRTPCSPHEAARADGVTITLADLPLPSGRGPLVIEGAGGVLVPLAADLLTIETFAHWGLPVVMVARTTLGTINHTLLSLEALLARDIKVAGVIFSGAENSASENAIVHFGRCRHLGRLPRLDPLDARTLATAFARHITVEQPT